MLAPTEVRDIDVVIEGVSLDDLRKAFRDAIIRETRFGGLTLRLEDWFVDVWPLESTWGWPLLDKVSSFSNLPRTTFFSLEAVAVELCGDSAQPRTVHQHRFEESIQKKTVFLNLPQNPYPELCIVRAFALARKLDFALAADLVRHLASWSRATTRQKLELAIISHYHRQWFSGEELDRLVRQLRVHADSGTRESLRLCFDAHSNRIGCNSPSARL